MWLTKIIAYLPPYSIMQCLSVYAIDKPWIMKGVCVYQENARDSWYILWHAMREQ